MSVWLPLMHTALMISRISWEAQMPRPNRLEVTPLHAQANRSQTKAQLAALGSLMEPCAFVDVLCVPGNHTLASNNIQLRRHLSKHVYEEPARRSSSTSPEARLSPGKIVFHDQVISSKLQSFKVPTGSTSPPEPT